MLYIIYSIPILLVIINLKKLKNQVMKNTKILNDIIELTENTIADYIYQLRVMKNSLLKCNYIVQVDVATVSLDENNAINLDIAKYPHQFSKKGVTEILKTTFYDAKGKILEPQIFSAKNWYTAHLKNAIDTRRQFRNKLLLM